MSGGSRLFTGSFIATGSSMDVPLVGFRPRKVSVINRTHPGRLTWLQTMPDASGLKEITAGTASFITSNGITPNATADGFTLGADTDINQSGDTLYFEAQD